MVNMYLHTFTHGPTTPGTLTVLHFHLSDAPLGKLGRFLHLIESFPPGYSLLSIWIVHYTPFLEE